MAESRVLSPLEPFRDQPEATSDDEHELGPDKSRAHRRQSLKSNTQTRFQRMWSAINRKSMRRPTAPYLVAALLILGLIITFHGTNSKPLLASFPIHKPVINTSPAGKAGPRELACTTWPEGDIEGQMGQSSPSTFPPLHARSPDTGDFVWSKPKDIKVVGLIFYGRREYVDVLDCYLRGNLVSNGGVLDEVHFVMNTKDENDQKFLNELVQRNDLYKKFDAPAECNSTKDDDCSCLWYHATDADTMYIKISDDIAYIHEYAMQSLVKTRAQEKDPFAIVANLVNNEVMSWAHYHSGAIKPYLPETDPRAAEEQRIEWRPSELPYYPHEIHDFIEKESVVKDMQPPYAGHRWLRLNENGNDILKTPIAVIEESPHIATENWAIGAQQLYSLLENIENDDLGVYHVGNNNGILDLQFREYNIDMMAIWGSDIMDNLPFSGGAEQAIAVDIPKRLGRKFLVDTRALAARFHFPMQQSGMTQTDLLDRYRAYANERICVDEKKKPLGPQCPGF